MECVPVPSVLVANVACPEPSSAPVPSEFAPSLNVTLPVGVPPPELTTAVNVTGCPYVEGFASDVRLAVVLAAFTVCASAAEVLPAKFPAAAYATVIECAPLESELVV